ncbi:MAG TPA: Uma2 family endonuclease [Polyangia bacterium]|nr:Uma2 family endonuclease [Polyangia bacterium]
MGTSQEPVVRRFTADEALRMVELGIIGEDEHLELLDGVLVEMSPQGTEHAEAIANLDDRLRAAYPGARRIRPQTPLALGKYDLPEPDFAVVRAEPGTFRRRHPTGPETVLVVELAWSSQGRDRRKAALYAAGGVEVYWLLDLAARTLEVRTAPADGAYQVTRVLAEDDVVELPETEVRLAVRELLP